MRRDLAKLVGGILLGGAMLVALAACASSTGAASSAPSAADATTPAAAAAPTTQQSTQPAGDPLAQGKLLFEKTAGGVGCAACHATDGKGNGPAGVNAPPIRGKTEADVRAAIAGGVPMMTAIIKLTDDEIAAVVAYLDYLSRQP